MSPHVTNFTRPLLPLFVCCNESKAVVGKALEQARPQHGAAAIERIHTKAGGI